MLFCFVMLPFEFYSPVSGGAIATVTMNVARELEAQNHDVVVLAADDGQPVYGAGTVLQTPINRTGQLRGFMSHIQARLCGWDWPNQGRFWRTVSENLKNLNPDIVVLSNDFAGASEVRRALPQAKVVVWVHNECHSNGDIPEGLAATDVFLTCSRYIKNWLTRRYKLSEDRVCVAHAGVDTNVFFPTKREPHEGLKLLFTGRLDPNKGVDIAVEAFRNLRSLNLPVSLTVAGHSWFYIRSSGEEEPFLKQLRLAMRDLRVDWLGHVPRRWIPAVMREHDVALVMSRSQEPFGLVVLEAMASGLAVVASPHGGLREACGAAGIFADPENNEQITQILRDLCENPTALQEWKKRSLTRASTSRWRQTADVLLDAVAAGHLFAGRRKGAECF